MTIEIFGPSQPFKFEQGFCPSCKPNWHCAGRFLRSAVAVQTDPHPSTQPVLSAREALDCEILYLLEHEPGMTQREIAQRMGVSLGRANYCLRALAGKGWLKLDRFRQSENKARYVYVLTPGGLAERARLAGGFLARKRAEYDYLQAQIARLERQVAGDAI